MGLHVVSEQGLGFGFLGDLGFIFSKVNRRLHGANWRFERKGEGMTGVSHSQEFLKVEAFNGRYC